MVYIYIYTYIYHTNQSNVGEYTSPMDPMGKGMISKKTNIDMRSHGSTDSVDVWGIGSPLDPISKQGQMLDPITWMICWFGDLVISSHLRCMKSRSP